MESSFLPLAETMSLQLPSLMTLLFNPLVILPSPLRHSTPLFLVLPGMSVSLRDLPAPVRIPGPIGLRVDVQLYDVLVLMDRNSYFAI